MVMESFEILVGEDYGVIAKDSEEFFTKRLVEMELLDPPKPEKKPNATKKKTNDQIVIKVEK